MTGLLIQAFFALLAVLGVIWAAASLARRNGMGNGTGAALRVHDRTVLSRDAGLAVVEAGGRAFLVGVTAQSVSLVSELDPQDLPVGQPAGAGGTLRPLLSALQSRTTRRTDIARGLGLGADG
ncbi:MAG: hypothetical protein CSA58_05395 [Micrococcales bacterium]|nr:MAG: hypothetical protein CSB46_04425 [Micrococcales bacterium]PIE27220.1 MAG: hypothetical protein CSA58_05395 [Micrococcales bacterium]